MISYGSSSRRCLVCGQQSFLAVHRKCDRKISSARARSSKSALAGRGQQPRPSAEVAVVPASFSDALAPVGGGASLIGQGVSPLQAAAVATPRPLAVDRAPVHDPASSVRVAAQHAARSAP